jgi:hypothetical protein
MKIDRLSIKEFYLNYCYWCKIKYKSYSFNCENCKKEYNLFQCLTIIPSKFGIEENHFEHLNYRYHTSQTQFAYIYLKYRDDGNVNNTISIFNNGEKWKDFKFLKNKLLSPKDFKDWCDKYLILK